jgi:hypothetical protein
MPVECGENEQFASLGLNRLAGGVAHHPIKSFQEQGEVRGI